MKRGVAMILGGLLLPGCLAFHRGALPGEPADATFAEVAGARIRYADSGGAGAPVVMIHGFAASMDTWKGVGAALEKSHRVIRLDLKGFGWSDRPQGDYSPPAQAKLVLALLDQLGVKRAAFVAHSWGASVALAVALEAPDRVERLALYDAFVYEEQLPPFFLMSRAAGVGEALFALWYGERPDERIALAFHDPRYVTEALVEDVEAMMARPGTRAAALAAVRGQRYGEWEDRYKAIARPALLLWGREDRVTPPSIGERLARELPASRLVVYPQCGHFPMIEAEPASTRELAAFLAEGGT